MFSADVQGLKINLFKLSHKALISIHFQHQIFFDATKVFMRAAEYPQLIHRWECLRELNDASLRLIRGRRVQQFFAQHSPPPSDTLRGYAHTHAPKHQGQGPLRAPNSDIGGGRG